MKIDLELFKEACIKLDGKLPQFLKFPPKEYLSWMNQCGIPAELKKFLLLTTLTKEYGLGTAELSTCSQIITINNEFQYIVQAGFFIIGSATTGDMLAIEWKKSKGKTGYLSHDNLWLWDQKEYPDPSSYFLCLGDSIGDFAMKATDMENFPLDYYGTIPE